MAEEKRSTVKKLPQEYLACRDIGHRWDELDEDEIKEKGLKAPFGWLRVFVCINCSAERVDVIDTLGEIAHRRYIYPQGYMLVQHTPAKAPFRIELARRRGIRLSARKQKP